MSSIRPHLNPALRRLRTESGFTILIVLGLLTVTMLLSAAAFEAVQGDTSLTRADLDGKRAYAAAEAGVQAYLYQLNANSSDSAWWATCANDTSGGTPASPAKLSVPGTTTGIQYSYTPVPVAPNTLCSTTDPVASLIDPTTGTLRVAFTGYARTAPGAVTRTIVASFRTLSPLSFLWYTVYETKDSALAGATNCDQFYYDDPSLTTDSNCAITWAPGDHMNGPMYTQDQFLIGAGNPASTEATFGRNSQDVIASQAPSTGSGDDICARSNCQRDPNILGTREPNVTPQVPIPSKNSNLLTDATNHNGVYNGTLTLTINGTTATGFLCKGTTAATCSVIPQIDLTTTPIIYATTVSGAVCTGDSGHYTPDNVSYSQVTTRTSSVKGAYLGGCGDVYVTGSYSTPLTIAAADDIVLTGSLTNSTDINGTTSPVGSATLGLVANQYVRVLHTCSGNPARTIDGAILTLQHSFFVDNYDCGGAPNTYLSVHGAIAQYSRGIVALEGQGGYLKDYNYDDRLALLLPPYLFDLQNTQWTVFRQTLCSPTAAASNTNSCSYTGS